MQPHKISAQYKKRDAQVQHTVLSSLAQFHFTSLRFSATKVAYFKIKDFVGLPTNITGAALFTF